MCSETYYYAGYLFDVERAKEYAKDRERFTIEPHRSVGGAWVALHPPYDLGDPVIFATFVKDISNPLSQVGALLIDGNHRMQWAAREGLCLKACFLSPIETYEIMGQFFPSWYLRPRLWKKLTLTAKFYGLTFSPDIK